MGISGTYASSVVPYNSLTYTGLLPLLKSIHKPCSLKKFAGQTIGVDAYGWLHRGTASCAIDLALDKPPTKVIDFAMNRVRMLVHFGITPYLVFDGDYLPSKSGTEKERSAKRKESRRLGLELLKVGKTSQAHLELQKAVDVTPEMARQLIEELKHHNVQYVVAPYEADSQLVYLERKGLINGILSEDSDLLVFGAKSLITKLDKYGECVEVNRNHFTACREISLVGWSDADFRRMAILSGCDYLPSIGKMGLKTAHRMLRKHKTVERLVRAAQFDGQFKVPPGYIEAFNQAELTFLYQWVFCPIAKQLVHLTPLEPGVDVADLPFIGKHVPADAAIGVANGNLHPHTKQPLVVATKDRSHSKPLKPARRVQAAAQTPDLKGSKPIDTFFKPKRTPLAELDPNTFTPSPSQQTLLEQQHSSGGWAAVLAPPTQPLQRTSSARTAPQPARRAISDSVTQQRSAPHPSKRQRLCSENVAGVPDSCGDATERSKFFAAPLPEPSPSLRTGHRGRKKSGLDFELHSDDSMDEAMAEVVDLEEFSQPRKKISIFKDNSTLSLKDGSQSTTFSKSQSADSQSTVFSRFSSEPSQESAGTTTPASSYGSPIPQTSRKQVSGRKPSESIGNFRSRFSFKPVDSVGTPRSTLSRSKSGPAGPAVVPEVSSFTTSTTAGETRQALCLVKNDSKITPPVNEVDELDDSVWAAMEAEVIVAASSPICKPQSPVTPRPLSTMEIKGSEDLLAPDSEAESDGSPRIPLLNLERFAFAG
jgi:exonuclease-1